MTKREKGGSLLALCMLLLLLGLLVLGAMNRQLFFALRFNQQEKAYLLAYNQALSALNFGVQYPWQLQTGWQCQQVPDGFKTCLYYAAEPERVLLYGESEQLAGFAPIRLYRLLAVMPQEEQKKLIFTPYNRGWLDYCPLPEEKQCAAPNNSTT